MILESILADLTRSILHGRPSGMRAVFTLVEVANLESGFAAHADDSVKSWDQKSLESYLLTQVPPDEGNCQPLLTSCTPYLWELVIYFSQWPFNGAAATSRSNTRLLPFDAWVRAVALLCGRHNAMVRRIVDAGGDYRQGRRIVKHMFRALAVGDAVETSTASSRHSTCDDDVLDVLDTVQPIMNEFTTLMDREKLAALAARLISSPGLLAPPTLPTTAPGLGGFLSEGTVPSKKVSALLDLSVSVLQQAGKFDTYEAPASLQAQLVTARRELQRGAAADSISIDAFMRWLCAQDDLNIYDAVALLFNTLPNPKSLTDGITIDPSSRDKRTLLLRALRRPGLTIVLN